MGFYMKHSVEELNENHEAVSNEAPVTGLSEQLQNVLKSATIVGLLEDYMRCGMEHGAFESFDAMLASVKAICDSALNAGDITSGDFEHVCKWAEAHRLDFGKEDSKQEKFIKHVCAEEVCEVVGDGQCEGCEDFARAAAVKRQCEQMSKDMMAKYGQIIMAYASDFMRLYGKNFNEQFRQKLGI